jgi:hypothetical protein
MMMFDKLKPKQKVLILDLMSRGGEDFLNNLQSIPYEFKEHRKPLIEEGILFEEKRKKVVDGKEKGGLLVKLSLTDKGWLLLQDLKDLPDLSQIKSYDQIKARIIQGVLSYISANNISFSQIFAKNIGTDVNQFDANTLLKTILSLDKNLFMASGGLRLSVLRKELINEPRDLLDKLLLELQTLDRIVLYRFDTPAREEDRKAALIIAGEPRHYLFVT